MYLNQVEIFLFPFLEVMLRLLCNILILYTLIVSHILT